MRTAERYEALQGTYLSKVARVEQILHPLRRLLALGQAQLHLQHTMGEPGDLRARHR